MKKSILYVVLALLLATTACVSTNSKHSENSARDIDREVLVSFEKSVPMDEARKVVESYGAEIMYSSQYFKYFHVRMSDSNRAQQLIASLEHNNMVSCVVPNQYLVPCSANVFILDDYVDPDLRFVQDETGKYYYDGDGDGSVIIVDEDDKEHNCYIKGKQICMTHGDMVEQTLKMNNNDIVVDRYDYGGSLKGVIEILDNICENKKMSDDNLNIINISLGAPKYSSDTQEDYKKAYIDFIKPIADATSKFDNKNFVITIAMGNFYEHNMEYIFEDMKKKLTPEQLQTIKNNIVFVEAKDERPQHRPLGYSNTISRKVEGINVIQVDLSDLPAFQGGTSAAAPLVANWISRNGLKKADDVIGVINKATSVGTLVSESEFENLAKGVERLNETSNANDEHGSFADYVVATHDFVCQVTGYNEDGDTKTIKIYIKDNHYLAVYDDAVCTIGRVWQHYYKNQYKYSVLDIVEGCEYCHYWFFNTDLIDDSLIR